MNINQPNGNEVINDKLIVGALVGGSGGDIIPPAVILEKLQEVLGDRTIEIFTGISNGAINPRLLSEVLNVTLLEDPIGDLIRNNINGGTKANLIQFGNIYMGMYKRVEEAVDSYYEYLKSKGYFEKTGQRVLLINPSTYPTIAPIIKYLESIGVSVQQIDEVGNNPNPERIDGTPMLPGLPPKLSNVLTAMSLNLITGKAARRWREILGNSVHVENRLPSETSMLFTHARDEEFAEKSNDRIMANNIEIIKNSKVIPDIDILNSLQNLFPEKDAQEIFNLINDLGILYVPRIVRLSENVVLDEKFNDFINLSGDKIFINSSSFDLEDSSDALINSLKRVVSESRDNHKNEIRIIFNDGRGRLKNVVIPEDLKENVYISSDPDYLTVLFHDPRIETIVSTFGQGTADLIEAFAKGKRIIGLNLVTDQKANIGYLNLKRELTGEPNILAISWKEFNAELLNEEMVNKKVVADNTDINETIKIFKRRVDQGAVFFLIRMLKSLDLSPELREVIVKAISEIGEQ